MATAVRVIARLVSKPDKVEEMKAILVALVEPVLKETGCRQYQLLQNNADPADFSFVEEWESAAALDAHMGQPHLQAALGKARDLFGAAPDVRRYTTLR